MRVAIFDGIMETHVGSSLERALLRRGHVVYNTGKVGEGFEFPERGTDLSHLHHAISCVLEHDPEWIIVMRPASLPPALLRRLKSGGANIAVWLSDDPVLLHLTYAPVLESYDLVLHCGTANVLEHYERFFGRPTGVNFPFWTDHEAFPYVWGTEEPESTAVFLGNVHNQVRRKRYFSLASMRADVRIHGIVGTDYLNLGGGYLDSDAEVVNAGARAKLAINIPQFFRDHRGLPTWFPGLDELGFFEYPSRVVQYIAMGLPVISVVPGEPLFASLPEMRVVDDMQSADEVISEWLKGGLAELSRAGEERFAKHFSADARVLAFESLVSDDSWRSLDAVERNMWFTQFDGRQVPPATGMAPRPRVEVADDIPMGRVLLIGRDAERPTSRAAVTTRALTRLGAQVVALDVSQLASLGEMAREVDGLVVCAANLAHLVPESLPTSAWRVVIDDTSRSAQDIARLLPAFDAIGVRDPTLHSDLAAAGHDSVFFCPPSVDEEYLELVAAVEDVAPVVRTWASKETDDRYAKAFTTDVVDPVVRIQRYSELWGIGLEELAQRSRARVGMVGFVGEPINPVVDEVTPFAAAAADVVIIPRVKPEISIAPYPSLALQVHDRGELALKLRRLADSTSLREMLTQKNVRRTLGAEHIMYTLISAAVRRRRRPAVELSYPAGFTQPDMVSSRLLIQPVQGGEAQRTLDLDIEIHNSGFDDHVVQIMEGDLVLHAECAVPSMRFILLAPAGRRLGSIAVRVRYEGPGSLAPAASLVTMSATGELFTDVIAAGGPNSPHTQVWRRV